MVPSYHGEECSCLHEFFGRKLYFFENFFSCAGIEISHILYFQIFKVFKMLGCGCYCACYAAELIGTACSPSPETHAAVERYAEYGNIRFCYVEVRFI